jgi:F-type H+-transporting ATPase subunit alpha
MPVELQVVSVYAGTSGALDDIPATEVRRFERELHEWVATRHAGLLQGIRDTGALPDDNGLETAVDAFHESFLATLAAGAEETVVVEAPSALETEMAASE